MDFPKVYRALAPLDSIIQAAGRCNREGSLPNRGEVTVFRLEQEILPDGAYRRGTDIARSIGDLRIEIAAASKKGNHVKSDQLHRELTAHQIALGFTPDDPPKPKAVPRKEESPDSTTLSDWPSPQEVRRAFSEVRSSRGWPTRDENLRSCGPVLRLSVSSCAEALLATKYEGTTLRAGRRHDNIVVTGSVG